MHAESIYSPNIYATGQVTEQENTIQTLTDIAPHYHTELFSPEPITQVSMNGTGRKQYDKLRQTLSEME